MKKLSFTLLLAILTLLASCKKDDKDDETTGTTDISTQKKEAATNYANIVEASYADAITEAKILKTKIDAFVKTPSADALDECKQAWLDARTPYGQTEAYRFYDGPIDNETDGPEGALNAWPLDEVYIDYTRDDATAGIINDVSFSITAANLRTDNEKTSTYIIIGYHAIEFMLWGQDNLDPSNGLPGQRAFTDYTTATNADRRKTYLALLADILIEDLESIHSEWTTSGAYRATFLANTDQAIKDMFTGIGELSGPELGGERMRVALEIAKTDGGSIGQEDEHSCFSDNTHNDIILNFMGCNNVLFGEYKRIDGSTISGTSLLDLVKERDANLATQLEDKANEITAAAKEIEAPFDIALTSDVTDIETTITALDEFSDLVADANLKVAE
jgi:putative iron-regulated protein